MARSASFSEKLRYRLDSFLARGSGALFISLVIAFVGALVLLSFARFIIAFAFPDESKDLFRHVWFTFLQLTDPGNMAQDMDTPVVFKVSAILAGFVGVVIFSALIAFLTTALDQAIDHLRKGQSRVLEEGHSLILGWSPRIVEILDELALANESEGDQAVVVLSREEKEHMDEYLRKHFTKRLTTRVVTRSGEPSSLSNLEQVSATSARSAIVLATCVASAPRDSKLTSDAHVIKTVMALHAQLGADGGDLNVVAEIFEARNRPVTEAILPGHAVVVDAEEILAKIIVQTSRTSGLSVAYAELLSFDGCEIYYYQTAWNGSQFGPLQFRFVDGIALGIAKPDGRILLRPDPATVLEDTDELIVVAQDNSTIRLAPGPVVVPNEYRPTGARVEHKQERMLLLGWGSKASIIVREYADYVLDGSSVDVMFEAATDELRESIEALGQAHPSLNIRLLDGNPLDVQDVERIQPLGYDTVLVMQQSLSEVEDPERADSETLVVLLHLRKLAWEAYRAGRPYQTKLVTEVLESSNQELIQQAGVNDFVISNRLISMIFAQLSEEPRMKKVYDDLFSEEGSEIYVKPVELYFAQLPVQVRFADLMRVAQHRDGEVCLGYKLRAHEREASENFGIALAPPKDRVVTLSAGDSLVVLAEDDC